VYIHTHTHISVYIEIVYEFPSLPNNNVSEAFLHTSGAVGSMDWIFIVAPCIS